MSKGRKRGTRKRLRLRKAAVLLAQSPLFVAPPFVYWYLLNLIAGNNVSIARDSSLAVYGAQIQVLGVLASLPPLLFVLREKVKPTPSKEAFGVVVTYASLMIVISMIGIGWSLFDMIYSQFYVSSVARPFGFAILDSCVLLAYMSGIAAFFDHWLSWAEWSFE